MKIIKNKKCSDCKNTLDVSCFYTHRSTSDGLRGKCKVCMNKDSKIWSSNNPEKVKIYQSNTDEKRRHKRVSSDLLRRTGVTLDTKKQMLLNQNNLCGICKNELTILTARVDHSHTTGKVRKILCHKCNSGLGLFNDSASLLLIASEYLYENN